MTTTEQLVTAASAADWSSFKSLLLSATPGDIAAIGSEWNFVMSAIESGVSGSSTQAPKALFTSTMTAFFDAASPYLNSDSVINALSNIASNAQFSGVDHLSVEMIAIMNAVPAALAATTDPFGLSNILFGIAGNQFNAEVTPNELKNTFAALTGKFGAELDAGTVLQTAASIADNDAFSGNDHLSSVRVLLSAEPANAASADLFALFHMMQSIAQNLNNPAVTPEELNSTFKAFTSHYAAYTDANMILDVGATVADSSAFNGTDYLSSVRTLLSAEPANAASPDPFTLFHMLQSLAQNLNNPAVTPEELNSTFKAFTTHYGALTDANMILDVAATVADNSAFNGADYLSSVRTLLSAEPANATSLNSFTLFHTLQSIVQNLNNPAVTPEELNSTFKAFTSHYGAVAGVNEILDVVSQISSIDFSSGTNNLESLRTLLSAHPDNAATADGFSLSNALLSININNQNAAVSEHELAQTLGKFMTAYGALTPAFTLDFPVIDDVQAGKYEAAGAIVNHLDAGQFAEVATSVNASSAAELLTTGNDLYNGSTSDKLAVYGGAGKDTIDFSGSAAATGRYLDGGAGRDTLTGGLGDDVLSGGRGADTLTGGDGADTFRFDRTGADHVTDFSAAEDDRIDLHDLLYGENVTVISDYVSLDETGGNTILSVDVDGAGTAHGFVQIAQLDNTTGLDVNSLYANGQIIV